MASECRRTVRLRTSIQGRARTLVAVSGLIICAASAPEGAEQSAAASAAALLSAARVSLGGEAALAGVKTLAISGRQRDRNELYGQAADAREQFTSGDLEIRAMLPDHYVRTETTMASGRRFPSERQGFIGKASVDGRSAGSATFQRAEFARLLLLLLLKTDTAVPMTIQGASSQDSLEFADGQGTHYRVDLDGTTHRPTRLRYTVRRIDSDGLPTGDAVGELAKTVVGRRDVGGVIIPDHITTTVAGELRQEEWYQSVQFNVPMTAQSFAKR